MALPIVSPDSELGKELAKWETPKREGGMRCDGYEAYPAMLYKADRYVNGKVMCGHPLAGTGDPVADAFTVRCNRIVNGPEEHERAEREGWTNTPAEAIQAFEKAAKAEADIAANEAYKARRMSEQAEREFDAAQDAAPFHAPEVVAKKLPPKKRSHHKQKPVVAVTPTEIIDPSNRSDRGL